MNTKKNCTTILFSLLTIILSACESTQTTNVPSIDIQKGSSTVDLLEVWGEPQSIAPLPQAPEVSVWTYQRKQSETNLIGAETVEIPYIHPITGAEMTLSEPVFQPQTTSTLQIIKVFIVDEKILAWKIEQENEQRTVQ